MTTTAHLAFLFLLSSPWVAPVQAADETVNMVRNPSFEFKYEIDSSGNVMPLYWSQWGDYDQSLYLCSWGQRNGERSFRIVDNSSSLATGLESDPMPTIPGQVYIARVWCRRSSTSAVSKIYLRFYDSNDVLVKSVSKNVGTVGILKQNELTVTAPIGSDYVRILLYSTTTSVGDSLFDGVSLVLADQRISDSGFDNASIGELPEFWSIYTTHAGAIQDAQSDENSKALRLFDASSTLACGACYTVPASSGVPYKFSASVRKADGIGSAAIYLKFYNSDHIQIGNGSRSTSSSVSTNLSVELIAPADTAYAKVLCYTYSTSTGTAYFDNISFRENYTTFYAAPTAVGNGSGDSAANAAFYATNTFWSAVDTAAEDSPVKVVLQEGNYSRRCVINGVGNSTNQVLVSGETPFAVNYCATDAPFDYVRVYDCENLILRHFHFTAEEDVDRLALKDKEVYDYTYVLRIGRPGYQNKNIRCEGVTFTDMLLVEFGATGAHYDSQHITWDSCSFVRIGWDGGDHCIYNAAILPELTGVKDLLITDCYFEDCNGAYIRFRDKSEGSVIGCTFIATGTQPTGWINGTVNLYFIQLPCYNTPGRDEIHGREFRFKNNIFIYEDPTATGYRIPFYLHTWGERPVNHPTYHWIAKSSGHGDLIENENTPDDTRIALIEQYFGINMSTDFDIDGNTFTNCEEARFIMTCQPEGEGKEDYWIGKLMNRISLDSLVGLTP